MNEYIEVRLRRRGKPLRIRRQVPDGVELDEPDPIQRTVYVGFDAADAVAAYRLRRIRQLHGWASGRFSLRFAIEDGTIVLRGVDQFGLPEGRYTLAVRLEDAKTRPRSRTIKIDEDGHAVVTVDVETDDRDVAVDLTECDADVQRVLAASSFDDQDAATWLGDDDWRATRKACLLNLLASLRARPTLAAPLIRHLRRFYWAGNDRAYAEVDADLLARLNDLSLNPKKPFYREGRPTADIHRKLVESIPHDVRHLFSPDRLVSFRGEGSPSLQTVLAEPPAGYTFTYAEFDLDLGNALQDVAGFVIHMGELAGAKPTNHLDLRKKLAKTAAGKFLYYSVRSA